MVREVGRSVQPDPGQRDSAGVEESTVRDYLLALVVRCFLVDHCRHFFIDAGNLRHAICAPNDVWVLFCACPPHVAGGASSCLPIA